MPSIIEAWFSSSEKMTQSGSSLAMVEIAASLEMKPEVKTSPASLPCRSASSASSWTSGWLVPEMLRVPPAPAPMRARRLDHGVDHRLVLAHAEIVVGAPHDDLAGARFGAPDGVREAAGDPLQVGENAVAVLGVERGDRLTKDRLIVHQAALLFGTVRK